MLKTPEEARAMWCPWARTLPMRINADGTDLEALPPHNRTQDENGKTHIDTAFCIADQCMAWRWAGLPFDQAQTLGGTPIPKDAEKGHCGLAGRP